ncbi:GNAT family N-acetyltransferase [Streptomyces tsukubensis]|uniref:GNAT family N-acetyltransferase n=1 Tax=Streptomyces tsukubensis TaxID=83656 RepID=UPI0009901220|nr:GNAT family N-acetyltransferase [Streptomyces tsukubensis]QFR92316.1 GNAT family N-acetyltransferase [Streptomyces tsukubensis]
MGDIEVSAIPTRRLDLLPLAVQHADEMAAVLADPALHSFIGGAPYTAPELRARYERLSAGSPSPGTVWLNWVVRLRDDAPAALVGTVQATVTEGGTTAEIAWVVGTPWQGKGIAKEAAAGLAGWLTRRGVRTLVAHIHPDHHASASVAAAVGLLPTPERQDGEVRWRFPAVPDVPHAPHAPHSDVPRPDVPRSG